MGLVHNSNGVSVLVGWYSNGILISHHSGTIHVTDQSDRTSSVPSSVLRLYVDKGQGLWSGILGRDSPSSTITVFAISGVFHWKSDSQRLR